MSTLVGIASVIYLVGLFYWVLMHAITAAQDASWAADPTMPKSMRLESAQSAARAKKMLALSALWPAPAAHLLWTAGVNFRRNMAVAERLDSEEQS